VSSLPWHQDLAGRLDINVLRSAALEGNHLGDPADRPLWVYLPPGYDEDPARRYASVYVIQGYTGQVSMWANRSAFRQPYLETADAVFARGDAPPCIVVYVDAWTAFGGRSSSTRSAPAATTATCPRTSSPSWTAITGHCPRPLTGEYRASPAAVSGP